MEYLASSEYEIPVNNTHGTTTQAWSLTLALMEAEYKWIAKAVKSTLKKGYEYREQVILT